MKKEYESPEIEIVKMNFNAIMSDLIDKSDAESGSSSGEEYSGDDPFA